jgi:hypothetical protein
VIVFLIYDRGQLKGVFDSKPKADKAIFDAREAYYDKYLAKNLKESDVDFVVNGIMSGYQIKSYQANQPLVTFREVT